MGRGDSQDWKVWGRDYPPPHAVPPFTSGGNEAERRVTAGSDERGVFSHPGVVEDTVRVHREDDYSWLVPLWWTEGGLCSGPKTVLHTENRGAHKLQPLSWPEN